MEGSPRAPIQMVFDFTRDLDELDAFARQELATVS